MASHISLSTPSRNSRSTSSSSSDKSGYMISEGDQLVTPRRQGFPLGTTVQMTPHKLHETEQNIKVQARKEGKTPAEVVRRIAGARAEIRAGYAVDGLHEWNRTSLHSSYISNVEPRTAAASLLIEDIFDALHALDRISDATIMCMISPKETSRRGIASLHQFASRSIFQNAQALRLFEAFRKDIAQPRVNQENSRINLHPFTMPSLRSNSNIDDLTNHLQRSSLNSQASDPLSDDFFSPSTSPTPSRSQYQSRSTRTTDKMGSISSLSASSDSTARYRNDNSPLSLTDALTFGESVERALRSLGVSEVTQLRVLLISLTTKEKLWRPLFEELGLSPDAAALMAIIVRDARYAT